MTPGGGRALPASAARAAGETRAAFTRSTVHSPRSRGPASQAGGSRRVWGQAHCCRWGAPGLWGCGAQGGTLADSHPAPDAGAVRLRSPDVAGPDLRGPESWSRHEAGGPTGRLSSPRGRAVRRGCGGRDTLFVSDARHTVLALCASTSGGHSADHGCGAGPQKPCGHMARLCVHRSRSPSVTPEPAPIPRSLGRTENSGLVGP